MNQGQITYIKAKALMVNLREIQVQRRVDVAEVKERLIEILQKLDTHYSLVD